MVGFRVQCGGVERSLTGPSAHGRQSAHRTLRHTVLSLRATMSPAMSRRATTSARVPTSGSGACRRTWNVDGAAFREMFEGSGLRTADLWHRRWATMSASYIHLYILHTYILHTTYCIHTNILHAYKLHATRSPLHATRYLVFNPAIPDPRGRPPRDPPHATRCTRPTIAGRVPSRDPRPPDFISAKKPH